MEFGPGKNAYEFPANARKNPYGVDTKALQTALMRNLSGEGQQVLRAGSSTKTGVDGDWGPASERALSSYMGQEKMTDRLMAVRTLMNDLD